MQRRYPTPTAAKGNREGAAQLSAPCYTAGVCNRFTLTNTERAWLAAGLGIDVDDIPAGGIPPRYNIAPTDQHWIVRPKREERELVPARWGLVNAWAKDRKRAAQQTNARAETLTERAAFREAFERRRCVVPADGFFEWTGPKTDRRPLWFHRPDGGLLLFAGLYESWWPAPGERERTFTIVTTGANGLMTPIHDRMPVILPDETVDEWLYPQQDTRTLAALLVPPPGDLLVATPVSSRVNSVKNDGPACLEPVHTLL